MLSQVWREEEEVLVDVSDRSSSEVEVEPSFTQQLGCFGQSSIIRDCFLKCDLLGECSS
jgi:hypothetical protein